MCQLRHLCRHRVSRRFSSDVSAFAGDPSVSSNRSALLFFGTDLFGLATLVRLHRHLLDNGDNADRWRLSRLAVVHGASVRRCPVSAYAESHQLPVLPWSPHLDVSGYNIAVVASFGHLIPKRVIDAFHGHMYNVHGSLLPRWRGATPIAHTIRHGDALCGVSIVQLSPHRFDEGCVLARQALPVPEDCSLSSLNSHLAEVGAQLMERCLMHLPHYNRLKQPQACDGVTYAPLLPAVESTLVDWRNSCSSILRQQSSLPPPLVLTAYFGDLRVRLPSRLRLPGATPDAAAPGQLLLWKRSELLVSCGDTWLCIDKLQPAGRRLMSGVDFYNGFLSQSCHDTATRCFHVS